MSIQLKGNDNSSFSDDVEISGRVTGKRLDIRGGEGGSPATGLAIYDNNDDENAFITTDGSASFAGSTTIGPGWGNDQSILITTGQYLVRQDNASQVFGVYYGGSDAGNNTVSITGNGSATFASTVRSTNGSNQVFIAPSGIAGGTTVVDTFSISSNNGSATFNGNVTAPNTFLALDTGGVLDVKERIQNTQAILYRLKAALIQPDADVNTLRQRLLEALDILTSDGDES